MTGNAPDSAPEASLADIVQLAADICDVPMAHVTSYQDERICVEHRYGMTGIPILGFCDRAILQDDLLEVANAEQNEQFRALPAVRQTPFVRFYAGAPLISPAGERLGTLALFDSRPRTINDAQRKRIRILAHQVMLHLELRRRHVELQHLASELDRTNQNLREQTEHLKQAQHVAKVGSWKYLIKEDALHLSDEILRMYGLGPGEFGGTMQAFIDLVHPEDRQAVRSAKDSAIRYGHGRVQCRVIRKDGEVRTFEIIGQMFHDKNGRHYLTGTTQDITEQKATESRIRELAYCDQLTGLPNRQFILDRIDQLVAIRRRMVNDGAVLFIDLDNFKILNDTHGHDTGDILLKQVAQRLQSCVRHYDCVGRFGGDEFVVLLEHIGEVPIDVATHALHVAQKIVTALNEPYDLGSLQHRVTPSIGIAIIDGELLSTADLLKRADLAMYRAKAEGRNAVRFFNPTMQEAVNARAALETDLRQAFADRAFFFEYQPQVDNGGHIKGAEALLRWQHPTRGRVPPAQFIPLTEELGLIVEIGRWLLEEACMQLVRWSGDPVMRELALSINVSARQFHHPAFVEQVLEVLSRTGANPSRLKIEVTESILIGDVADTRRKMLALHAAGLRFVLDDFGTGYSSLAYLQHLPLDQLKIDQSFVHDVVTDKTDAAITRSIISLAHNLGLSVLAEGVETEDQHQFLTDEGCTDFQGFLYDGPLVPAMFEKRVADTRYAH